MSTDLELAYLGLEVAEPTAFGEFLANVVGLSAGERTSDGATTWRNDDRVHRLLVTEGPANDASFVGFEATSRDAYDRAVERARRAGAAVTEGTAARRGGASGRRARPHRGALGRARRDRPRARHRRRALRVGVGSRRLPHQGHGFRSRRLRDHGPRGGTPLRDRGDRSPAVGLARDGPGRHAALGPLLPLQPAAPLAGHRRGADRAAQKLHHVMVETVSQDNVGSAFDRAWTAGLPIANALGKHDNDKMFSFYVVTPAGFQLEFGYGARTIDDPWTENRRYDRISEWGHQPIASPFHTS